MSTQESASAFLWEGILQVLNTRRETRRDRRVRETECLGLTELEGLETQREFVSY